ncbi:MAG TPA: DUF1015 family protein [Rhodocyclaceae bacterium]|nr:DUF1015 family protein [Rhodocyclaceae bacterium]HMV21548.1 DUF1015 family protein [Rhodocyclaceae bacterium]HNE41832.1 DUF1015 family protein [Rhodocyclaceae bacterium]HNL20687.1 DUF1015 family protein [Rhodocyclaceae bacterium]HNM21032.1 DUF1015 family protein [Rhodocyclaceae bacterium]
MPLIRPFAGLRPAPGRAGDVAAPPYDVLSSDEARERAAGRPWSFLHISKAEIDLPADVDPYSPSVYARSAANLAAMISAGVLIRDESPRYYAYRLVMGNHVQTGLVAAASVADYDSNRIRRHEFTRPDKEDDRVRQIEALNAHTGPVLLAYPDCPVADGIIAAATAGEPLADVTADGVRHMTWAIEHPDAVAALSAAIDGLPCLYIADGHHRSAAASRVAAARRKPDSADGSAEAFLSVMFPAHEMRIMDYNRLVRDLNGLSPEAFLAGVSEAFEVVPVDRAFSPESPGIFALYLAGRWHRLAIDPCRIPLADPVARLDVSLLSDHLLGPILGIADLRRDKRIDFVGGIRGLGELERRVDSGEMAVAFALHPTRMADLMAVADAGEVMPPKSTWFEPKLADGLLSHVLD